MVRIPYVKGFNNRLHSDRFSAAPPLRGYKPAREPGAMHGVRLDVRTWRRTLGKKLNTQEVRHDRNHSN